MKNQINNLLFQTLRSNQNALSAWLGGSAATNREDELSDIDIVIIGNEPNKIFNEIEHNLDIHFGLKNIWHVVESSPYQQKFYILTNSSPTFYVDVVIYESTDPEVYREYFNKERHGFPVILFDKTGILQKAFQNPKKERPIVDRANTKARFEIMYRTFLKEYIRGKFIDAYVFYSRMVALYVYLERITISPQKHDFGLRYLYLDFPHEKATMVEDFLKVADLETMKGNAHEMKQRMALL